jgi:uncharacterized protein (TIGR02265 family)
MANVTPTIKGIFVKSHINAVKEKKGSEGIKLLEQQYGEPLDFKNTDNVLVSKEVKLIEYITQILADTPIPDDQLAYEAGKQHFRDFATTPLARIVLPFFKNQFKSVIMQAQSIAGHVFQGVIFSSQDLGEHEVKLTMKNNDYPLDHFKGFFQAWMEYSGLHGTVTATNHDGSYDYVMKW